MAKSKVSEWDSIPANNTDVGGVTIAEGMNPGLVNNAMRTIMAQIATATIGSDDGLVTGTAGATGTFATWNADGDLVEGRAASGQDATLISGTAGTDGNLMSWNADGDAVDSGYGVLDEDDLVSDSATAVATQQSVKAYVDAQTSGIVAYRSTAQTITANSNLTLVHGLGGEPDLVVLIIQCTSNDEEWVVGDRLVVSVSAGYAGTSNGFQVWFDNATEINVSMSNSVQVIGAHSKTNRDSVLLENSRWQLYVNAFRFGV